jgi:hypothetical protein
VNIAIPEISEKRIKLTLSPKAKLKFGRFSFAWQALCRSARPPRKQSGAGSLTRGALNPNPALNFTQLQVVVYTGSDFNAPHISGNCYWRFKPTGSPPTVKQTFKLLPGTTPSNGCRDDSLL